MSRCKYLIYLFLFVILVNSIERPISDVRAPLGRGKSRNDLILFMANTDLRTKMILSKELVKRASDLLLSVDWKVWYFGDNAGFWGLKAADEINSSDKFSSFGYGLLKGWQHRTPSRMKYDQTLPGREALEIAEKFGDRGLIKSLRNHADWIISHKRYKGVYLTDDDYPKLVWVDALSLHPPFLAKLGNYSAKYYDIAASLAISYAKLLQDSTGLFTHTYDTNSDTRNNVHWGRGQGWAMTGLLYTLSSLPLDHPLRDKITRILNNLLRVMVRFQMNNGHWTTIIDDGESPIEASVAAFFVITGTQAIMKNLISLNLEKEIEKAFNAVVSSFSRNGFYRGVSEDTWSGNPQYYKSIKNNSFSPWSQGPPIAAINCYAKFLSWKRTQKSL